MKRNGVLLVVLVVLAVVSAMIYWNNGGNSGKTGTLNLQITDAPSPLKIQSAFVTLSEVKVHMADAEENNTNSTDSNETNSSDGWLTVVEGPVTYDLVSLIDAKELLGNKNLEAGKYTQIRLNVDSARVVINGTEYNLTIPSSEIKVIHPFDIVEGNVTTLTLDFDANASVIKGVNNTYKLNPRIKIIDG